MNIVRPHAPMAIYLIEMAIGVENSTAGCPREKVVLKLRHDIVQVV